MNSRWLENAISRRSSIPLNVLRELRHLVIALDVDPAAHLRSGDGLRGVAEPRERREHPADDREGRERAEDQDRSGNRRDDLHRLVDLLALVCMKIATTNVPSVLFSPSTGTAT